jgi:hypothetical protein
MNVEVDAFPSFAVTRTPWNKGKLIGAKPPPRPKHVWSIRTKLQVDGRLRDSAMFNLATQTSGMNFVEENGGGLVPAAEKGWNVILYHYSAGEYLHAIAKHGLTVGDVPTNIMAGLGKIGVWLSSADHPGGNCLGGSATDKSRFRSPVEVTPEDPCLVRWTDWRGRNVTAQTIEFLERSSDAMPQNWWVYFGLIEDPAPLFAHPGAQPMSHPIGNPSRFRQCPN